VSVYYLGYMAEKAGSRRGATSTASNSGSVFALLFWPLVAVCSGSCAPEFAAGKRRSTRRTASTSPGSTRCPYSRAAPSSWSWSGREASVPACEAQDQQDPREGDHHVRHGEPLHAERQLRAKVDEPPIPRRPARTTKLSIPPFP